MSAASFIQSDAGRRLVTIKVQTAHCLIDGVC